MIKTLNNQLNKCFICCYRRFDTDYIKVATLLNDLLVGKNIKLNKTELKAESSEVQNYLRQRSALDSKDDKIYRKFISDQEDIF